MHIYTHIYIYIHMSLPSLLSPIDSQPPRRVQASIPVIPKACTYTYVHIFITPSAFSTVCVCATERDRKRE